MVMIGPIEWHWSNWCTTRPMVGWSVANRYGMASSNGTRTSDSHHACQDSAGDSSWSHQRMHYLFVRIQGALSFLNLKNANLHSIPFRVRAEASEANYEFKSEQTLMLEQYRPEPVSAVNWLGFGELCERVQPSQKLHLLRSLSIVVGRVLARRLQSYERTDGWMHA